MLDCPFNTPPKKAEKYFGDIFKPHKNDVIEKQSTNNQSLTTRCSLGASIIKPIKKSTEMIRKEYDALMKGQGKRKMKIFMANHHMQKRHLEKKAMKKASLLTKE